jgi:hypothetical protein
MLNIFFCGNPSPWHSDHRHGHVLDFALKLDISDVGVDVARYPEKNSYDRSRYFSFSKTTKTLLSGALIVYILLVAFPYFSPSVYVSYLILLEQNRTPNRKSGLSNGQM